MKEKSNREKLIEQETTLGIAPLLPQERKYGFLDAFLIISGYAIATWCYTQGATVAGLLDFKQLIANTFGINILVLAIVSLPILFSVRYGIDVWIWFRSIFGLNGCKILTVLAVLANFPWYAVCAELFSSSMSNLLAMAGIIIPESFQPFLGVGSILLGTAIAIGGPTAIQKSTRIMVPSMLGVGIIVVIIAMTSVPTSEILNYQPDLSAYPGGRQEAYMRALELNIAFAFSWSVAMFVLPRLCKKEKHAYWATVTSYGVVAPFFCFAGGVLAIAMFVKFGVMSDDPTYMLANLASPPVALLSLVLVAFANIGTQGVGSYMNALVLKSSFPKVKYNTFVFLLAGYVLFLTVWNKVIEYFSSFLAVETYLYAPIMAVLVVDFFFVKHQHLSLRDAYFLNSDRYRFTHGFNLIGLFSLVIGFVSALLIFNPISGEIYSPIFYYVGASSVSFFTAGIVYLIACKTAPGKSYMKLDSK